MTTARWLGRAKKRAQVNTYTIGGTWAAADTLTMTINGKAVTFTCTTTAAVDATAGLYAALAAATEAEFTAITWASPTTVTITATSTTAGTPFVAVLTRTTAASGTVATAATTTATGPNHWEEAVNWDTGAIPSTEDIVIGNSASSILYGWPSSLVTLGTLVIADTFTGQIGLPEINAAGYREYLPTFMTNVKFTGSMDISASGAAGEIRLSEAAASTEINIYGGTVRVFKTPNTVAFAVQSGTLILGDSAATAANAPLAATLDVAGGGACYMEANASVATIRNAGVVVQAPGVVLATSVINRGGTIVLSKNPTTLQVYGGVAEARGDETITTLGVGPGTLDLRGDIRPFTATNYALRPGWQVIDPNKRLSGTSVYTHET